MSPNCCIWTPPVKSVELRVDGGGSDWRLNPIVRQSHGIEAYAETI